MATKKTSSNTNTTVTRIKAKDTAKTPAKKEKVVKKPTAALKLKETVSEKSSKNPLRAIGGYFKGAWEELRQVRWPNRRATWSLTAAMLIFTSFFVVLILLLDALFKYIFQLILG